MARIGVFASNLSPKTGGVFSLIDGLMAHAGCSRHTYLYLAQREFCHAALPPNVETLGRPRAARIAVQAVLRVPGLGALFRNRSLALGVLAASCGVHPRVFTDVDLWLWPHCFVPVPNLGRVVAICHDMIHRHHPECFSRWDLVLRRGAERSLETCAAVLCPSRASADDLVSAYPKLARRVVTFSEAPCEVASDVECEAEGRRLQAEFGDVPLFLFVAVDWPHKNHELLIDAAVALRARTSRPFKVLFVGHRRRGGAVEAAIRRKCATDLVRDLGRVSRPRLAACYRRARAFLYPSLCEGFGIPLVEAMQYGVPVIASDRSCIPTVCGDGAVLLPPTSSQLWAEQMNRLLADGQYHATLAAASRRRGQAFSWQQTWRELDDAFSTALRVEPSRGPALTHCPEAVAYDIGKS